MSDGQTLGSYNMETLYQEAKQLFETVDGVTDPQVAEPYIEQLLSRHLLINIRSKSKGIHDFTPEQFEELKTDCLTTIQLAYLTVCDEIQQQRSKDNLKPNVSEPKVPNLKVEGGLMELSQEEITAIAKQVETQFHKAFWDKLSEDLKDVPPRTDHLLVLLGEVSDRLDGLTPNNQRLLSENGEQLDLGYLRSQFNRTDSGWVASFTDSDSGFSKLLGGLVHFLVEDRFQKMVAPVYDEELKEWWSETQVLMNSEKPLHEKVPTIFKGVYRWLEVIETGVREFYRKIA